MTPLILDTDIGSDIDDALALLFLLHLPDVDLLGISTVYGKVHLRARIASVILTAAGRRALVSIGCGFPKRAAFPTWHTGLEGVGLLDEACIRDPNPALDESAVTMLTSHVMHRPGKVKLAAIGPLMNIADAMDDEPGFPDSLAEIVFMGGGITYPEDPPSEFRSDEIYRAGRSHNVGCDVESAQRVFSARARIRVLTNDVTTKLWWEGAPVAAPHMDVVTTSGTGTGRAPTPQKIEVMKRAIGDAPLAVASGVTPGNVERFLPWADCIMAATGISRSFYEFDPRLVQSLVSRVKPTAL